MSSELPQISFLPVYHWERELRNRGKVRVSRNLSIGSKQNCKAWIATQSLMSTCFCNSSDFINLCSNCEILLKSLQWKGQGGKKHSISSRQFFVQLWSLRRSRQFMLLIPLLIGKPSHTTGIKWYNSNPSSTCSMMNCSDNSQVGSTVDRANNF